MSKYTSNKSPAFGLWLNSCSLVQNYGAGELAQLIHSKLTPSHFALYSFWPLAEVIEVLLPEYQFY